MPGKDVRILEFTRYFELCSHDTEESTTSIAHNDIYYALDHQKQHVDADVNAAVVVIDSKCRYRVQQ